MKLKQIPDGQEYISNSLKYANWKIIFEVLAHFGIVFTDDELSLLVNNSMDELKKVISKIYYTYTKYLNSVNTLTLAKFTDGIILVAKERKTKIDSYSKAKKAISEAKGKIVGSILIK